MEREYEIKLRDAKEHKIYPDQNAKSEIKPILETNLKIVDEEDLFYCKYLIRVKLIILQKALDYLKLVKSTSIKKI